MALSRFQSTCPGHTVEEDLLPSSDPITLYDIHSSICSTATPVPDSMHGPPLNVCDAQRVQHLHYPPGTSDPAFGYYHPQRFWQDSPIYPGPSVSELEHGNMLVQKPFDQSRFPEPHQDLLDYNFIKTYETMLSDGSLSFAPDLCKNIVSEAECCHVAPMVSDTDLHHLTSNSDGKNDLALDQSVLDTMPNQAPGTACDQESEPDSESVSDVPTEVPIKTEPASDDDEGSDWGSEKMDENDRVKTEGKKPALRPCRTKQGSCNRRTESSRATRNATEKRTSTSYDPHTTLYLKTMFFEVYGRGTKLTKEQRREIELETGLTSRKITYWFSNHKRRYYMDLEQFQSLVKAKRVQTYKDFLRWKKNPD